MLSRPKVKVGGEGDEGACGYCDEERADVLHRRPGTCDSYHDCIHVFFMDGVACKLADVR